MAMDRRNRFRTYRNAAYDPWATRVDMRVQCSVCGFAGIDPERWQEPDMAVYTIETTGTTYQLPVGTPVEELGDADKRIETRYATYAGCPLCGSPAWGWGTAPDLLRH